MSVRVRVPTPLRKFTQGSDEVDASGDTVLAMLEDLEQNHPGIKERICDEAGELRYFVNVYLNGEDVRFLDGLKTEMNSGDELSIVPAVAGGSL